MATRTPVTWSLLGLIALVFLGVVVAADVISSRFAPYSVPYQQVVLLGAKNNAGIAAGEWWRLGTSMLLHGDILHVAMNAYALYVLGVVLERLYGARRFLLVFFVAGLGGALASYSFTQANSVGASGAIFGLLGAAVVFGYRFRGILPARIRRLLTVGLLPWVALNMAIGFVFPVIDNAAHLGGMFTGGAVALVLGTPLLGAREARWVAALQWGLLAALLGACAWSVVAGIQSSAACARTVQTFSECFRALTH